MRENAAFRKISWPEAKMPRTDVSLKEARVVYMRSGGVCAFPGCGRDLLEPGSDADDIAYVGEVAHIVSDSRQGPRGRSPLSGEERDRHPNLILLCRNHHKVVDTQVRTFSVPVLQQMKADHEGRIRKAVTTEDRESPPDLRQETVHSSLLPVTDLPQAVFSAPCDLDDDGVREGIQYPPGTRDLVRYILREKRLYTFHDLRDPAGPFAAVVDVASAKATSSVSYWDGGEGQRRFVSLLNRALYKYTALLGVRFDPEHHRFYFEVETPGKARKVRYRPLNAKASNRSVVWQPTRKSTGEAKGF